MQFDRPPFLEVIASLKWIPVSSGQMKSNIAPEQPQPIFATPLQDDFISGFAKGAAALGLTVSERMVPPGMPYISYQPALRVRALDNENSKMLYQVGPGLFSANAVPPYRNWEAFRPFAQDGLDALLMTRNVEEKGSPFINVALRYMNLFTSELVGQRSTFQFFTEVMGFELKLPETLRSRLKDDQKVEPQLSLRLALRSGLEMHLNFVGTATIGDKTGILMDIIVASKENIVADHNAVSQVWEEAHTAIQDTFLALTTPLHSTMRAIG